MGISVRTGRVGTLGSRMRRCTSGLGMRTSGLGTNRGPVVCGIQQKGAGPTRHSAVRVKTPAMQVGQVLWAMPDGMVV